MTSDVHRLILASDRVFLLNLTVLEYFVYVLDEGLIFAAFVSILQGDILLLTHNGFASLAFFSGFFPTLY